MQEIEGALQVHINYGVPLGFAHTHHKAVLGDSGVVHKDINPAELLFYLGHNILRGLEIGRIGGVGPDLYSKGLKFFYGFLRGLVDNKVRECYIGPFRSKFEGNGLANATCGARYQRDFSV